MDRHAQTIRNMFSSVASRYDLLNHLLSLDLDRRWRRKAAAVAFNGRTPALVLDLCAGTGDMALALARQCDGAKIIALDFARPMLERARAKINEAGLADRLVAICGDALRLPFADHSFDLLTVAFGLRNVSPIEAALREAARVVRPGGQMVILEFALPPRGLWRRLYGFYFFHILPMIGRWISGTSAYAYLAESVALFPQPDGFRQLLAEHGFVNAQWRPLACGAVALHTASVACVSDRAPDQPAQVRRCGAPCCQGSVAR
ncbi:bifunctional demethylmenaquinone methyltransferase/2-methoxy-6-polyprenyl-1,4-benzoquinol methylase UbiE [Candidatus Sumerlaeota bacterium]|nr:bifunctional demethylmenaquinone methyltransferase/2-methoxy-6-polyprenyl-1,4-benzoquinol methylase UbiE [Candidatus Sumerlaeota bacterium]